MAFGRRKRNVTVDDKTVTAAHEMTLRQSLIPCFTVTILFFLWGFAYGLLDVLNSKFQSSLNISASKASGLSAAYFGAYFLCPLTISGYILRRWGFRITFITGLSVFGVGCLLFWPSGVYDSFGGFCGSMFVVGAGLSTLETAADPFLSICGPPRYSEIRLNLAQAVQGVGGLAAPLLASYVFFTDVDADAASSLKNVQWVYLGVGIFVFLLAGLFFFLPMPEVTDADMEVMEREIYHATQEDMHKDVGPLSKQYNLFLGISSQFCYVGAQVAVANYFINFAEEVPGISSQRASALLSAAQGIYAGMRFICGFAMMHSAVRPRWILLAFLGLSFIFAIAAMNTSGNTSIAMLMLVLAWESACFATIFTTALRGLGRHTKLGGSFLVAAISGGAVFPAITGAVVTARNAHFAMIVPAMGYLAAMAFPVYVNFWNRDMVDEHRDSKHGMEGKGDTKEARLERGDADDVDEKGGARTIEEVE